MPFTQDAFFDIEKTVSLVCLPYIAQCDVFCHRKIGEPLRHRLNLCFSSFTFLLCLLEFVFEGDTPHSPAHLRKEKHGNVLAENHVRVGGAELSIVWNLADAEQTSEFAERHYFFVGFGYAAWFELVGVVPHELPNMTVYTICADDHVSFFGRAIG